MLAEVGTILLLLSAVLVGLGWTVNQPALCLRWATGTLFLALLCLMVLCFQVDLSVQYVAAHTSHLTPWYYRVAAAWSAHEGAWLLWCVLLGAWGCWLSRQLHHAAIHAAQRVMTLRIHLGVLGAFIAVALVQAFPFARWLPQMPSAGADLNPLLQDGAVLIHPPILSVGYMAFSVLFSAVSGWVLTGAKSPSSLWALIRKATLLSVGILTAGIMLGSWWAFYELGWGGWWFWDPVENMSLVPWLLGVLLIHALLLAPRYAWAQHLVVIAGLLGFVWVILSTALVRLGAIDSVHGFAQAPDRLLALGSLASLGALTATWVLKRYYQQPRLMRASSVWRDPQALGPAWAVLILATITTVVMVGTWYPFLASQYQAQSWHLGPDFFYQTVGPLAILGVVALALLPHGMKPDKMTPHWSVALVSLLSAGVAALMLGWAWWSSVTLGAIAGAFLRTCQRHWRTRLTSIIHSVLLLGLLAMTIHAQGLRVWYEQWSIQDTTIHLGQQFQYIGMTTWEGPQYDGQQATIQILNAQGTPVTTLTPERRWYHTSQQWTAESALWTTPWGHWSIVLGHLTPAHWAQHQLPIRLQWHPGMPLLWLSSALMAVLLGLMGYRTKTGR